MVKRTGKNIVISFAGNLVGPLTGLIVAPVLAQGLGADGRGIVAAATAPALLADAAATFGIPESCTYFIARQRLSQSSLMRLAAFGLAVAGSISVMSIILLSSVLSAGDPGLGILISICSASVLPGFAVGLFRAVAAGQHMWERISAERTIAGVVRLVAVVALSLLGALTTTTAALTMAFAPVVGVVAYISMFRAENALPPMGRARAAVLYGYSWRIWLGSIAGVLLSRLDQLLVTPLATAQQLGFYVVAVNIAELPLMVSMAVRDVLISRDAESPSIERIALASRLTLLVCFVLGVALAVVTPFLIGPIFGGEFVASISSVYVMLLSVVASVPGSIAGAALIARGRPGMRSGAIAAAVPVNIAVLVLAVPTLGSSGASIATAVGSLIASVLAIVFLRRIHQEGGFPQMFVPRMGDLSHLKLLLAREK